MSAKPLLAIVDSFVFELDQIEATYYRCRGHSRVDGYVQYVPSEEGCLFALWDAWNRFLRTLTIVTNGGDSLGLSGAVYSPSKIRTEYEILSHLATSRRGQKYKFTNGEPNWYDGAAISDIVTVLQQPNASIVIGAVTASNVSLGPIMVPSPLPEIRAARNFSAHKNWKTFSDLSPYSSGLSTLSDHLRQRRSGVETFSEWKESLEALAASAAQ